MEKPWDLYLYERSSSGTWDYPKRRRRRYSKSMPFARRVGLVAHYEMATPNEPTWWAESTDLPGFTAVYPSLGELQRQAEDAVHFALETNDVEVEWAAAEDTPSWAAVHIEFRQPEFVTGLVNRSPNNISVQISADEVPTVTGAALVH
jgi:hypothetical protein